MSWCGRPGKGVLPDAAQSRFAGTMIRVRFFTILRLLVKRADVILDRRGISVRDLLDDAQRAVPVPFLHKVLDDEGKMKRGTLILVNGRHVQHLDGLDTIIEDGDEVSLFPPGGGG
ncbi:MAG TPA: MoaD/ThiS family protein [Spirochaetota bacterium]|nr:MoaD/ThiS family protein [Spirochaetota bacterium]HQO03075.1 MoaD/ThiS family protein [Spirochaetota bacterium]HQP48420.1 MoaD/ThiS family protein [Spirochaetota bacterium]